MYLDVLIRKMIKIAGGSALLERQFFNFVSGATAVDNPTTLATDITITGDGGAVVTNASTGTINDQPTDGGTSVRHTGVAPTVTGYAGGTTNRRMLVWATGGPVILANQDAGSVAANRIVTGTGASVTIPNGAAAWLAYDATTARWRFCQIVGGSASAPTGTGFAHVTAGAYDAAATANMSYSGGGCVFNASGFVSFGATVPASGLTRVAYPGAGQTFLSNKDSTATDRAQISASADNWTYGNINNNSTSINGVGVDINHNSVFRVLEGGVVSLQLGDATTDYVATGSGTKSTVGFWRLPYAATDTIIGQKDSGGTDRAVISRPSADTIRLGDSAVRTYINLGADSQWISNTGEIVIQTSGASQPIYLAHGGPLIKKGNGTEYERVVTADVQTTDATVTNILTGTIASNTCVSVDVDVNALQSTFANAAGYQRVATFKNNAGTVTQVGTTTAVHTAEDQAAWDVTVDFTGTTWRVRVTGAAATTINWRAAVRVTTRN